MLDMKSNILIIDDDLNLAGILENILEHEGYFADISGDGDSALQKINKNKYEILLLDLKLPDCSGIDILKAAKKLDPLIQVIMVSGKGDIDAAVTATKFGAYDFLEKPVEPERILVTLKNALEKFHLEKKNALLIENAKEQNVMIGSSTEMKIISDLIEKAAGSDSKVLITGENGTGKELVAKAIYLKSERAAEPFITVNCAAMQDTLIESELFGYKKGAFTGANTDRTGKFQLADGGVLFLDEIGDMSTMTQAKVLRAIEENIIEMVGGVESIPIDVRIIAATNKNLLKEMENGNFREDLFFRLNVLTIEVPPLRERQEDIPFLLDYYLTYYISENLSNKKEISKAGIELLMNYLWPGNVRELKNLMEKVVVLFDKNVIEPLDISTLLNNDAQGTRRFIGNGSLKKARSNFERDYIYNKLIANKWNITRTAEVLDIPRTYLHKKIKDLDINNQRS